MTAHRRRHRLIVIGALSIIVVRSVLANPSVRSAWIARYGSNSASMDNLSSSCTLCHATSGGANWNGYGWSIRAQLHAGVAVEVALVNVEMMNGDAVSANNIDEITDSAQPGWTSGPNNTFYFPTSTLINQMPAALVAGEYDPIAVCAEDVNGDSSVNVADMLAVINGWGLCAGSCPPSCVADITHDCVVNVADLLAVIGAWGACP